MRRRFFTRVTRTFIAMFVVLSIVQGLSILTRSDVALAFKPIAELRKTDEDKTHAQMVVESIRELVTQENIIPGVNKISRSMQKAIDAIKLADAATDYNEYSDPAAHFTNDTFATGNMLLLRRYEYMKTSLRMNRPDIARKYLGRALHAIQDFYTHTNWVELGNGSINPNLANFNNIRALYLSSEMGTACSACTPDDCVSCVDNITTPKLTSGWFQDLPGSPIKPAGRCSHGGPGDFSDWHPASGGMNKDTLDCSESPHSYMHLVAAFHAKQHTKEFMRFLRKNLTLKEFKLLLGVGNTLGFAIDTSGSMGEEIAGVKAGANAIVDARIDTPDEPAKYVLVEINDPYTIVDADTDNPDEFKAAVNGLGANGGGDCPELAFMAIIEALGRFDESGGELMIFTDATVKDGGMAPAVIALAQKKEVKLNMMLSGSCSPIDPEFYRVARETGGQAFVIDESDAYEATKLADFVVRPDSVDVAHINGILSATPVTYTVPVDSTMTSVTFSVSGATTTTITRPNSTVVAPTDPGVSSADITGGKVLSIANPADGIWSVTVSGDGEFTIRVTGESPLRFSSFDFVEAAGPEAHGGYTAISGNPIAGQLSKVDAEVSAGDFSTAQFELRSPTGALVQTVSLSEVPNLTGDTSRHFSGDFTLTGVPVLAHITGVDINGQPYQRVLPKLIKPQTVQISAPVVQNIYPGHSFSYTAQVTNHGPDSNFELDVTDARGFIGYVSPSAFTLNNGASILVTVTGQAPGNTPGGTVDSVTLSVESTGVTETKNFTLTDLTVLSELDLSPQSVQGSIGAIGTVRLFDGVAPPGGTVVTLESSNPTVASVPATITVPAGYDRESFEITTTTVATTTPVTITATYGLVNLTSVLQVVPAADSLVSLELNPSTVKGGGSSKATINLNGPAPVGGATVTLSSDLPAATVPASVVIPEEASSATFTIDTATVTASTTANISAVYSGITKTTALKINPTTIDNVSVLPDDVAGGIAPDVSITLSAVAPAGGAEIALASGNTSIVTVPATVTVPAGQSVATFLAAAVTSSPTTPTTVAIKATYEGVTTSGYLRVTPSAVPSNLYFNPSKLAGGETSIGTVEINSNAPAGGTVVTLSTTDASLITLPASITIPEGQRLGTFNISTSAVTEMKSVSIIATAGGVGRTEPMTIVATSLEGLSLVPSSIGAGTTSTGQVTMSNPAPVGGALVALASSDTAVATVPETVAVPEGQTTATFLVTTASVPNGATPEISASYGGDTESATLRVFGANDVFGTIVPNGPPVTITTTTAGQNARLVFEGTAGQRVSLKMSGVSIVSSWVTLLKIDGTELTNNLFVTNNGSFLDVTTLPATGTYTIFIDPNGTATGSMTLQLYDVPADVTGSIAIDGASVGVTTSSPGQNARLMFDASAGQRITVQVSSVSLSTSSGAQVSILNSSQTVVVGPVTVGENGAFIDTNTLATAGTYTLMINPTNETTGSMSLELNSVADDVNASITPGGAAVTVTTTSLGQNANVTFSGTSGQRVSLKVSGVTLTGGNGYADFTIKKPDGSTLTADTFVNSATFIDTQVLPASGTYNIFVNPQGTNTGSATLTLYAVPADVTGTIVAGGAPVTVTTTVPGQNGQLSFNGTANQRVTVNIGGVNMTGGNGYLDVSLKKPDGSQLAGLQFISSGGGFINTQTLPVTGSYTLLVNPQNSNTGSATLTLNDVSADVISTITPGGSPVTVTTTSVGQNAQVTFDGTSGQRVSLKISGVSLTGGNGYVDVYLKKPDGTTLGSTSFVNSSGGFIDTKTLPVTGTYTILVDPQGTNIGSVTLTLYDVPANVTGPIIPGGSSVTVTTTTPGQNAELNFAGLTNQRVLLRISGVSLTGGSPNYLNVSIKKPDGSSVYSTTVDSSGGYIDTQVLPVDGAYTVVADPQNTATGSAVLTLYNVPDDITNTVTPGDPAFTVTTTTPGQNGRFTFTATANQRVFVRITSVSLTGGSPNWANVAIKKPDGSHLISNTVDSSGGVIDTTVLPVNGAYTLLVDPLNFSAGSLTITLYNVPADASGTIVPGGSSLNLATTAVGQNAVATFSGTATQRVSLSVTNISVTNGGSVVVYIKKPDGSTLALTSVGGSTAWIDVKELPVTGTYSILVDPNSLNTASFTLTLYDVPADTSTSTTINASAISVSTSVPGQNTLVTFPGTSGQQVTIRLTNNLIGSTGIKLLRPDGTTQVSTSQSASSFNVPAQTLGTTGTYTVVVDPFQAATGSISVRVTNP